VRWRRPGRGTLLRLAAVAALLATAAAVLWSPPKQGCDQPAAGVAGSAASGATRGPASSGGDKNPANGGTGLGVGAAGSADGGAGSAAEGTATGNGGADSGNGAAAPGVPEGSVGVPIRLADPTALGLVRPGNRVDLLKVDDAGGKPAEVAGSALVLRVTGANDPATGGLLLALTPQEASQAVATSRQGFAIVIRPD
jgi:hypothetical protein